MSIVGHILLAQDNGTHMFRKTTPVQRCTTCGHITDYAASNPDYVLKKNDKDLSFTFDNRAIASCSFKDFCEASRYEGLAFLPFKNDPKHFHFIVQREIAFDTDRRKTRFAKPCTHCGNYESVAGATPAFLKVQQNLPDGFWRTDVKFGSGDEKQPLIIIGTTTKTKLEAAKLRGLEFADAYGT